VELLQLKYFCDAAQTQNFSKTAKKFMVPTSNISQSIKRLETELETKLFNRSANKIELNAAGEAFYKNVSEALSLLQLAKSEARSESRPEPVRINIQVNRNITMNVVEKFQKTHPEISFDINHSTNKRMTDFDVVVTDRECEYVGVRTKLIAEPLLIAYNKNLFCLSDTSTVAELEKLPFVSMRDGNSMHYHMNRICADLGFSPRVVLQSEDPFYIRKCIELGLGVAFVPKLSWSGQFGNSIGLKSIGDYTRTTYLYYKNTKNKYITEFCDMLRQSF